MSRRLWRGGIVLYPFLAMILCGGGFLWWSLSNATQPNSTNTLVFPEKKAFLVPLTIALSCDGRHLECAFSLEARPTRLGNLTHYHVRCNRLQLFDIDQRELFRFQRVERQTLDGSPFIEHSYSTHPSLTEERRRALFAALAVDTTTSSTQEDHSLLQEAVDIVVSPMGEIRELRLTRRLRNALYDTSLHLACGPLLRALLSHPDQLPSLLGPLGLREGGWKSEGKLLQTLEAHHHARLEGDLWRVITRFASNEQTQTIQSQKINDLTGHIEWSVDQQSRQLTSFAMEASLHVGSTLLGNQQQQVYTINVSG